MGDDEHVEGVVSDRDILVRCIAGGDEPGTAKIGDYMSSDVITIEPTADPFEAASIMRMQRFHRMPVAENGRVIGVISLTDITQAMDEPLHDLLVGSGVARRVAISSLAGVVNHYFNHIGVALLRLQAPLHKNDSIRIVGHSTDLQQLIMSMEIDHDQVDAAYPGDDVALKVNARVRTGDYVYIETSS